MFCECRDYATALVWSDWLRLFGGPVGQSPRSGWFHRVCGSSRLRQNHNSPRCGRKHVQGAAGVLTGQTDHCSGSDKENEWYEWYEWYWTFEFWGTHGVLYLWTKPFLCHFSSDRRTCLFIFSNPELCIYIYILLSMFERWTRKKLATWISFRCFLWLIHFKSYSGMFSPSFHGRKTQRTHIYHRFDINRMTSMDEFKQTHSHIPEFSPCKLQVQVVDLLGDFSDLVGNADLGCLTGTMGTGGVERIRQTIDEHVPEVGCSRFFEVFWSIFCGGFVVVLLDIQILFVGKIIAGILGFDFVISKDRSSSQNFATSIPLSKLGSFAVKPVFAWCVLCGPTCNP